MSSALTKEILEAREILENDLFAFAQYVNPHYVYGDIHRKVFERMSSDDAKDNQLILLPRGHLKSHCVAVWTAWEITRMPWLTFVYLSAGEDLANAQIHAIKNMLTCPEYRYLWPEMINEEEGKREKWSAWAFSVDHPERRDRGVRDNTIIVKTVKSNAIGLHCDRLVLDDVVVPMFAYSAVGRKEVQRSVSQFASIKNPGAKTKAVGTIYHPADLYSDMKSAQVKVFNEDGELTGVEPLWEVIEEVVENSRDRDGTGQYLWPRTMSPKSREWYGFDRKVLAQIQAEYESHGEREQFFAQYYMEANDPDSHRLSRDNFQYYDKKFLRQEGVDWFFRDTRLRLYAAMDVAGTGWQEKGGNQADYTAIAVIGVCSEGNIYVLDLRQFKTSDFNEYYKEVIDLQLYWGFRKITVETNSIGKQVKKALENLIYENGIRLVVDGQHKSWRDGSKQERHAAYLEPKYRQGKVFHYKGGLIPELEEQIILARPRHDDLEDALCIAVENARPPGKGIDYSVLSGKASNVVTHERFGGRRRR